MTTPTRFVDDLIAEVFAALSLPAEHAYAVPCGRPEWGDLQCNGALPAGKAVGRPPRAIAAEIAERLSSSPVIARADVAGPGFVNIALADGFLSACAAAQAADPALGAEPAARPQKVVLDFGGPNIAKPLHVGHLRSLVIGESLRRILTACGHSVVSDIHLGDWGLQMGMLLSQMRIDRHELPHFDGSHAGPYPDFRLGVAELERAYTTASAACKADPDRLAAARRDTAALQAGDPGLTALWRLMRTASLASVRDDVAALAAHFDLWDGESDAQPLIGPMLDDLRVRGLAVESDGALVMDVSMPGDEEPRPPLLLLKSDGAALYGTTDLATLRDRVGRLGADRVVYCVDMRQSLHLDSVFRAARIAGYAGPETVLEHAGFGTVNGVDGRPFKTRDGGAMRLSDLLGQALDEARSRVLEDADPYERERIAGITAVGAVKFADLASQRQGSYVFDAARLVAPEGRTGPYLQYACARIGSVMARADAAGIAPSTPSATAPEERELVLACLGFPAALAAAERGLCPHTIAEHAYGLAQSFSRFYANCPVISAEPETAAARLALAALTRSVLSRELELLGIDVPGRM